MKKLLALVLALVMVLSLAVSAFAVTLVVDKETAEKPVLDLNDVDFWDTEEIYLIFHKGGTWYMPINLENGKTIKTAEVTVDNDFVTAEIIDYDPETMAGGEANLGLTYKIVDKKGNDVTKLLVESTGTDDDGNDVYPSDYDTLKDAADEANKLAKTKAFTVKVNEGSTKVLKLVVADNYTVDYKEATVKVTATDTEKKPDTYTKKINVVSDVAIYEHNTILYAAEEDEALTIYAPFGGYSAYLTKGNYGYTKEYEEWLNRYTFTTTVLPTTGFRAIAGKKIVLSTDRKGINVDVTIPEVAAGQKGVNFAFVTEGELVDETTWTKGHKSFSFGFKGQQTIASDYTIDVDLNCTYYQLRQLFRQKLEEEDVLKFYILKDGKAFDELVVDFMTVDDTENVEFTIEGKAGTNLGYYTVTLTAPAAEEGETNPDTGAESMIGVVAAMAVITLASAAAISLKK